MYYIGEYSIPKLYRIYMFYPPSIMEQLFIRTVCSFLFMYYLFTKFNVIVYFYRNRGVHVSVLYCEDICTTTQHYNSFQYAIVTSMNTHADLM